MTAWSEEAIGFDCQGDRLVGVIARPAPGPVHIGVVIVVGGPQYRAGSHRQFVELARDLAAAGLPTLRFDVRGMGDSEGAPRTFETLDDDIAAAIDALCAAVPGLPAVALWGLCDGASAALLYLDRRHDARVRSLVLANPWVRSQTTLARAQVKHYYVGRLLQPTFWRKLAAGGVGREALRGLVGNVRSGWRRTAPAHDDHFTVRMARAARRFNGPMLLLLSQHDQTASEFDEACRMSADWQAALARDGTHVVRLDGADHTLSDRLPRRWAHQATIDHLRRPLETR